MKIIFLLGVLVPLISAETIILNQQDLSNCNGACDDEPNVYDKHGCKKISGCKLNTAGWDAGFLRCDYCLCQCEPIETREAHITQREKVYNEDKIYRNCKGTCAKKGLVRTNYEGCSEVRDCKWHKNGWTWWFWRCDYCTCNCLVKTYTATYRLTEVKYDMSATSQETQNNKQTMAQTDVVNEGDTEQKSSRTLSFTQEITTSITTSIGLEVGVSLSVEAGVSVGVASVSSSVTSSISASTNYERGTTTSKSFTDSFTAEVVVPPKSSKRVMIVGHRMKVSIPYTAVLVTEYKDGTSTKKPTSGVYTNISVGKFRVQYEKDKKLA